MRSIQDELTLRRLDGARTDNLRCLKGKPCGDRCIPRNQECHEGAGISPIRQIDRQFGKLSRTERLLIGGAATAVLAPTVVAPLLVKPTGRAVVNSAVDVTKEAWKRNKDDIARQADKVKKQADEFVTKQSANAASTATRSATETFNELNRKGNLNETYQTVGNNVGQGLVNNLQQNYERGPLKDIVRSASTEAVGEARKQASGFVDDLTSKESLKRMGTNAREAARETIQEGWDIHNKAVKARTRRITTGLRSAEPSFARANKKRIWASLRNSEPQFAKDMKKRLGIKTDSLLLRYDRRPKCGPGSKPCGSVCIPSKNKCRGSERAGQIAGGVAVLGLMGAGLYAQHHLNKKMLQESKEAYARHNEQFRTAAKNQARQNVHNPGKDRQWQDPWAKWNAWKEATSGGAGNRRTASGGPSGGASGNNFHGKTYRTPEAAQEAARIKKRFEDAAGVKPGASKAEAKKAYRKWAMKNHPDVGGDENTFKDVSRGFNDFYRDSLTISSHLRAGIHHKGA